MKVMFDTNVLLDALVERQPFAEAAGFLFSLLEDKKIDGIICATSLTTISYIAMKYASTKEVRAILASLLRLFEVAPVNRSVIEDSINSGFSDFEDAVLYFSAVHMGADAIVTRDQKGFSKAKLSVYSPKELLSFEF